MCDAEMKARKMINGLSYNELMVQWRLTSVMNMMPELASVRGWIMDEIERRFPNGYSKWLEQDAPEDDDLIHYVKAEMLKREVS